MFSYLHGIITEQAGSCITLDCHDIGFEIHVPNPYRFELQKETTVYIHFHVREDVMELFGFATLEEKKMFESLINVKGLGPKGALAILASSTIDEILAAIEAQNAKFFSNFPGIGSKLSQQIILDLKGKVNFTASGISKEQKEKMDNASSALHNLGYSQSEIKLALKDISWEKDSIQEIMKKALRQLNK
jgi:Holliday junction DNA helicase RuvA